MLGFFDKVLEKLKYSLAGLRYTYRSEPSIRQWSGLIIVSDLFALFIFGASTQSGIVFALGFLLIASELANTAIEIIVDHVHPEHGDAAKNAKDAASAVTFVTFLALVSFWGLALLGG